MSKKEQVPQQTTEEWSPKQIALRKRMSKDFKINWQLYVMVLIPVIYYIIFRYIPMFGNIIAFRKYKAGGNIFGETWTGFRYFEQFVVDRTFWRAFFNTLILNGLYLLFRFPLTLIFALLINEIRNLHWKKFVQTVSYLPHFISIVIVCGMLKELLLEENKFDISISKRKSDVFTRCVVNTNSNSFKDFALYSIKYMLDSYFVKGGGQSFGCCDLYEECSDAKKCMHENKLYARGCKYRRTLSQGKIFYGKNRNI